MAGTRRTRTSGTTKWPPKTKRAGHKRINVLLPDVVRKRAKSYAAYKDVNLDQVVAEALREFLREFDVSDGRSRRSVELGVVSDAAPEGERVA
jgi:hypothetical protein